MPLQQLFLTHHYIVNSICSKLEIVTVVWVFFFHFKGRHFGDPCLLPWAMKPFDENKVISLRIDRKSKRLLTKQTEYCSYQNIMVNGYTVDSRYLEVEGTL